MSEKRWTKRGEHYASLIDLLNIMNECPIDVEYHMNECEYCGNTAKCMQKLEFAEKKGCVQFRVCIDNNEMDAVKHSIIPVED